MHEAGCASDSGPRKPQVDALLRRNRKMASATARQRPRTPQEGEVGVAVVGGGERPAPLRAAVSATMRWEASAALIAAGRTARKSPHAAPPAPTAIPEAAIAAVRAVAGRHLSLGLEERLHAHSQRTCACRAPLPVTN